MSFLTKDGKFVKQGGKLVVTDDPAKCPCCVAPVPACYKVSGPSRIGPDCCSAGGCCNYGSSAISEVLAGDGTAWTVQNAGPVATSTWVLERNGNSWTLKNNCQRGCHVGMFEGSADNWDGRACKTFTMRNGYLDMEVCPVDAPCPARRRWSEEDAAKAAARYPDNPLP